MMKRFYLLLLALLYIGVEVSLAQAKWISGTVTDKSTKEKLPGVSVIIEGTTNGVATDIDGKYKLQAKAGDVLKFSFVGMQDQKITVGSSTTINVEMTSDSETLDEVMVVAYGTAKKESFTGSASVVKSDELVKRQTSNVTQALAGQIAGVQAQSNTGQPGSAATIRIRGVGSMAASNAPLYVVDGVPYDGDIAAINPSDIASMTVLKDAASNALYGARGANGVILINTKKGIKGKTTIKFEAKVGTNKRAVPNYDVIEDPDAYMELLYLNGYNYYTSMKLSPEDAHMRTNAGFLTGFLGGYNMYTTPEGESLILEDGTMNPNATQGGVNGDFYYTPDSWYDELFDSGNTRQEYNVSISGSDERFNYYLSAGYLDDSGIISGSGYNRFSTRLNADYQAKDWLKVGANFSYVRSESNSPANQDGTSSSANLFYVTNYIAPVYPLYVRSATDKQIMTDDRGFTVYDFGNNTARGVNRSFMNQSNPAAMLQLDKRVYTADIISMKGYANADLSENLSFRASWGVDVDNQRYQRLYNPYYGQYSSVGGIVYVGHYKDYGFNQQYLLNYNKSVDDIHNFDIMIGYENYIFENNELIGSRENVYNGSIVEIDNAINSPDVSSSTVDYATQGFLGRVQYNYDNKYYLSGSYRRDASSRFHPDHRWGNFWSLGGAWSMNKEGFLANATFIDFLKYKISYGVQGNDALLDPTKAQNYYPYKDQYELVNQNNQLSTVLYLKGNPDITWETSHSFNTGFDFSFGNGRLSGAVEYFQRKTTDMLYHMPVAGSNGYATQPFNVGSVKNAGFEVDLQLNLIRREKLDWNVYANGTHYKNKILELSPELEGELIDGSRIYREGESMYQMYLRQSAGVNKETGAAQWYILNKETGEKTLTEDWGKATKFATGDMLPKLYGGFGTSLNVLGFDASVQFAYQFGGQIYDSGYAAFMHTSSKGQNWHKDMFDSWTPENSDSDIPMLNYGASYQNGSSDRFLISSNYLSIQNVTVGYTIPNKMLKGLGISNFRIYAVADNLALFSKRKGLDPRQSFTSASAAYYSPIKSISGGLSLTF